MSDRDETFTIEPSSRQRLLDGTDEIDLILKNDADITAYECRSGVGPLL